MGFACFQGSPGTEAAAAERPHPGPEPYARCPGLFGAVILIPGTRFSFFSKPAQGKGEFWDGRCGKGGERGASSSQALKLDLGGGVGTISQPFSAWNLQRPAISSKIAPHALDISTLRPERLTGKSISGGRLPSGEAVAGAPPFACQFSGTQTHLVQCIWLWNCILCVWCARGE